MTNFTDKRFRKLVGLLKEQEEYEETDDEFMDRLDAQDQAIKEYWPYFMKAGFYGNGIDFSSVKAEAIIAMGEALKKLYS